MFKAGLWKYTSHLRCTPTLALAYLCLMVWEQVSVVVRVLAVALVLVSVAVVVWAWVGEVVLVWDVVGLK